MGSHFSQVLEAPQLEIDPRLDSEPLLLSSVIAATGQKQVFCDSVLFGVRGHYSEGFPLTSLPHFAPAPSSSPSL